jgi:hypothetical protein
MADYSGMAVAGYMLTYTLIRKLEAKALLTRAEAEELIEGALRQLQGPHGAADPAIREADSILRDTLAVLHEGAGALPESTRKD